MRLDRLAARSLAIEQCEPRQLLAADISIDRFYSDGTVWRIDYSIAGTAGEFDIAVFRSTNGVSPDGAAIQTRTVNTNLEAGSYTLPITPDFDDSETDYFLIADIEPSVDDSAGAGKLFAGGVFVSGNVVHVQGNGEGDTIDVAKPGLLEVAYGDQPAVTFPSEGVTSIHLRSHGGNDSMAIGLGVTQSVWANGGAGDDTYSIAITDSPGSAKIVETAGNGTDTLDFGDSTVGVSVGLGKTTSQSLGPYSLSLSDAVGIENLVGTPYDDTLIGNGLANSIDGQEGNDTLYADDPNLNASVVGRRIFYNQSGTVLPLRYDGNDAAINSNDDLAIATDKVALLPGTGPATFDNLSTYSKGINGIMIDIAGAHGAITASDFIFRIGNNNTPGDWSMAPSPTSVSVRIGAGVSGSDRVEIVWPNNAIEKKWLEVTTRANANTRLRQNPGLPLGQADAFFFGNVIGDTGMGDSSTIARVNAIDEGDTRSNALSLVNNIPVTNLHDFNRDSIVNLFDQVIARSNLTNSTNSLRYIDIANPGEPANEDLLLGGAGEDTLAIMGTSASDTISATSAGVTVNDNAILYTGFETLVLDGGAGNDVYAVTQTDEGPLPALVTVKDAWTGIGSENNLIINGSAGPDDLTLTDDVATLNATTITRIGMTRVAIAGGDGNDRITLTGGYEIKTLSGGAGDDTLTVDLGSFSGTLQGGSGQNIYAFNGFTQGIYTIDQTGGQADTLDLSRYDWGQGATIDLLRDDQQLVGSFALTLAGASDSITTVVGTNRADSITANNLGNVLQGGAGNDTLTGRTGNDTLQGGTGNDTLNGGAGLDTILTGLGEGAPTYFDIVNDSPAATQGLHQAIPRRLFLGNPDDFILDNPSAPGIKYSFALTESGLAPYAAADTIASQPLTFSSAGTQRVWGRTFQSADTYTTYRTDVTVDAGYGLTGDVETIAAPGPYRLALVSGSNTDAAVYTDWIVDWGDGTTLSYSHINPTVSNPVFVSHVFPAQTGARQIRATVSDGVHSPIEVAPFSIRVLDAQPFPPANVKAQPSGTSVIVAWDHPLGPAASTYTIFSSDNGIDGWEVWWGPISSAAPTSVSRSAYEKKFFKMVAENEHGSSLDSPVFTAQFSAEDLAVEVSARVADGSIVLDWPLDIEATQYTVYRRAKGDTDWGTPLGTAPGNSTGFEDTEASDGSAFEYKVVQGQQVQSVGQYISVTATGYVYAGTNVPLVEDRGTTILLVDATFSTSLASEISQLQQDLVGDGWKIIRHDVARATSVTDVKALIVADYESHSQVNQVLLLGHVAVPYSGYVGPDGHYDHQGAWAADAYYGDLDGTWTDEMNFPHGSSGSRNWNDAGDGKFDQSNLSGSRAPELAVGRIDMWGMSSSGTYSTDEEAFLLQRYLERDHDFRNGAFVVPRQAFVDIEIGLGTGAISGFRNLSPLVGDASIQVPLVGTSASSYFPNVTGAEAYLWSYAEGLGYFNRASRIGTTGDFMSQQSKVVFTILRGSYFGDWDVQDNFLRAPLAGQGYGLTASWENSNGSAQWSYYRMGLGETIGESIAYSQNGGPSFQPSDVGVWMALMGDPSLRMHVVKPPSHVTTARNGNDVDINWTASQDQAVIGYHIYRGTSLDSLARLNTGSPVDATSYTDPAPGDGPFVYMVRAVKLETGASGTYYNASQGAFGSMLTVSVEPQVSQVETDSGATFFVFNVMLSTSYGQTLTVAYHTAGSAVGNAAALGVDYSATSGVLTFAVGETVKSITVEVFGDTDDEGNETFQVILSTPQGSDILALGVSDSLGTILDDE